MKAFLDLECGFLFDWRLGKNDLKVLIALVAHSNNATKECFPRHKKVSEMTGIHYTHISTSVRRLCEFGWIKKAARPGKSNSYQILGPLAEFDKGQSKVLAETARLPKAESVNHNYKENYKNNYKRESSKKEQLRSFKVFEDRFGKSFQS